ncbi:IS110 family transposase [Inquilinus sp. Marseille-Q2685]|uniref:IS110 family transposase n=1 Tax=Inquilinus sp. Marseille-Q2685 TaxID=2866581 RepID=UPI001CE3B854|nr:IS110 family transposase [Inquilinus sp. Marseille-Q2685]
MVEITRIGMDTSKSVFQLHGVDAEERVVLRKKLRRRDVLAFFAKQPPCGVGMEACGGSHYWARELQALGHQVELIPPQYVKPYVPRGKHDAADAEGICEAMSRPKVRQRLVPVKSAETQAALMLIGLRDRLVRQRTRLVNTIRGYATEFGLVAAKGPAKVTTLLRRIESEAAVPETARALFAGLAAEHARLKARIKEADAKLMAWHRQDEQSRRLAEIPSIGPIGASLLVLKAPDPQRFRSGRDFAAWIGLTPKNHSTAGKQRLGVITRAGDETLRSQLVGGATSLIRQARRGTSRWAPPWLLALLARKPPKLAAVALANKVARIAWKLMVSGERYRLQPTATLGA